MIVSPNKVNDKNPGGNDDKQDMRPDVGRLNEGAQQHQSYCGKEPGFNVVVRMIEEGTLSRKGVAAIHSRHRLVFDATISGRVGL